jgi:hypothetical protein
MCDVWFPLCVALPTQGRLSAFLDAVFEKIARCEKNLQHDGWDLGLDLCERYYLFRGRLSLSGCHIMVARGATWTGRLLNSQWHSFDHYFEDCGRQ